MSNNGGPWGGGSGGRGGGGRGEHGSRGGGGGGRRPGGDGSQIPEIDDLMNRGREHLRVLMGGRGGSKDGGGSGGGNPLFSRGVAIIAVLLAVVLWLFASFYSVKPEQKSVELFLGKFSGIGTPGLNFAPWPLVTHEVLTVTREQTERIGGGRGGDEGLILTGDENIVDIDFSLVWNIRDPAKYLFNLRDPEETIRAVASSAMRQIIAQSELGPILNRDRGPIAQRLEELVQSTLDSYDSGVNVVRVNFDKADPPSEVIDAFRKVQAAEQERDRVQNLADAYANRVTAEARGQSAAILEDAEAYRAQQVNEAQGAASRFKSILAEYNNAPSVTRKRLYLERMEQVLGDVDKIILDESAVGGGTGVVPYLPLNELRRSSGETGAKSSGNGAGSGPSGSGPSAGASASSSGTQSGGT